MDHTIFLFLFSLCFFCANQTHLLFPTFFLLFSLFRLSKGQHSNNLKWSQVIVFYINQVVM